MPEQHVVRRLRDVSAAQTVEITIDGAAVTAYEGETVATVLMTRGKRTFFEASQYNLTRTLFCGMGVCHQCLVTVDGVWNRRACMTTVKPGMTIETSFSAPEEAGES